jgi:hypothetical protein
VKRYREVKRNRLPKQYERGNCQLNSIRLRPQSFSSLRGGRRSQPQPTATIEPKVTGELMVETGVGVSVPCLDKDATSLAVFTTRPLLLVATTRCLTPCLSLCPSWCLNPLVFPYDIGLSPVTSVSEGVGALVYPMPPLATVSPLTMMRPVRPCRVRRRR